MKKIIQLISLLLAAMFLLTACGTPSGPADDTTADTTVDDTTTGGNGGEETPEEKTRWGHALNIDGDAVYNLLNTRKFWVDGEWSVDDLEADAIEYFNDHYQDCGLSDILYSIEMTAPYASDDPDLYDKIDKYYTKEENGVEVDYTEKNGNCYASWLVYENSLVDPYQVWFEQCRLNGINPWLSFRMNDVHYAHYETGHSPFGYLARENGWLIGGARQSYWNMNSSTSAGDTELWFANALDYSVPQVREQFLKRIDDRLSTYDAYGIELDWQRQIWSFPTDDIENCKYMNEFIEDVNEIVEKYEAIWGHDIKIAIRINRDIDENMYFGFDVRYLAQQGWIDVVIPSCYWGATDSDMPIAEWVEELKDYNIQIWAGLESCVTFNSRFNTIGTLAGFTAQYLSQGADKIYTFNLFNADKARFKICESLETALSAQQRRYVVTEANCTPFGVGFVQWKPLPMYLSVNNPGSVVINHGTMNYTKDTVIYVGVMGVDAADINEELLTVTYNGVVCEYDGISKKSFMKEDTQYGIIVAYNVPKDAAQDSLKGEIEFDPGMTLTVAYVELMNGNSRLNVQ